MEAVTVPELLNDADYAELDGHVQCAVALLDALLGVGLDLFEQNLGVYSQSLAPKHFQGLVEE
jgi:hypothetical protein